MAYLKVQGKQELELKMNPHLTMCSSEPGNCFKIHHTFKVEIGTNILKYSYLTSVGQYKMPMS